MIDKNKILKFDASTITFSEIMIVANTINEFFKETDILNKLKTLPALNDGSFINIFNEIPGLILNNDEILSKFLHVVNDFSINPINDNNGKQTMSAVLATLDFINEVGIISFLYKTTTTFRSLISE